MWSEINCIICQSSFELERRWKQGARLGTIVYYPGDRL